MLVSFLELILYFNINFDLSSKSKVYFLNLFKNVPILYSFWCSAGREYALTSDLPSIPTYSIPSQQKFE